jgi:hypothetical protein
MSVSTSSIASYNKLIILEEESNQWVSVDSHVADVDGRRK